MSRGYHSNSITITTANAALNNTYSFLYVLFNQTKPNIHIYENLLPQLSSLLYPVTHSQVYPLTLSVQVPPFLHGRDAHSSTSTTIA